MRDFSSVSAFSCHHQTIFFRTSFFITASRDGHVKFWKKNGEEIEFVKHFRAHLGNAVFSVVYFVDISTSISFWKM